MTLEQRINAFAKLGLILKESQNQELETLIQTESSYNPWFIPEFVRFALAEISRILEYDSLKHFTERYDTERYDTESAKQTETVAVIAAGNIPLVGFFDFFDILICGKNFLGKLSSQDARLLPFLAEILCETEPEFRQKIQFSNGKLSHFDKIIATGSNSSATYFNTYFETKPRLIRHHRNSIAILTGNETDEDLSLLADDIFMYFGMGCRNVSKVFVPQDYNFSKLIAAFEKYRFVLEQNHHYLNNLDYVKSVFYINKIRFSDAGIIVLKEDNSNNSPVACLHFEYYFNISNVINYINKIRNELQCVVSTSCFEVDQTPFGKTQKPELHDFSDGIDVIDFLLDVNRY